MVIFWLGFGGCALVLSGAEMLSQWQDRRVRIKAARKRDHAGLPSIAWPVQ